MKKIILLILLVIVSRSMILGSSPAFCWEKESFFLGEIFPFRHSFSGRGGFFFGGPGLGMSPFFSVYPYPYYYPYYPQKYKEKYQSPYPAEIKEAGRLSIQIVPGDAEILLNGYPLSGRELGLLIGKYQIEARREGYEKYKKEIDIKTAATTNLKIILGRRNSDEKEKIDK